MHRLECRKSVAVDDLPIRSHDDGATTPGTAIASTGHQVERLVRTNRLNVREP
jgi:hypothetical protein